MSHEAFTPRTVVKYVVTAAIHAKVASTAANAIADYTSYEKDETPVKIASHVVGWGVSAKVKPYSDKAVDKTADFIAAQRAKRTAKKNAKQEQD